MTVTEAYDVGISSFPNLLENPLKTFLIDLNRNLAACNELQWTTFDESDFAKLLKSLSLHNFLLRP